MTKNMTSEFDPWYNESRRYIAAANLERKGNIAEAIRLYSESKYDQILLHAAEVAYENKLIDVAKELAKKVERNIEAPLNDKPPYQDHKKLKHNIIMHRANKHKEAVKIKVRLELLIDKLI